MEGQAEPVDPHSGQFYHWWSSRGYGSAGFIHPEGRDA
jgi:hypothetical protein